MFESFDFGLLLSFISCAVTTWFWFVKANREKPDLDFHQLSDFRISLRRHPEREGYKRLGFQQLETGGVLIVNHSIRQNSIVLFECFLETDDGVIEGDWGYVGDDKPPWNVGPETSIAFSPACFFDVPETFEVPDNPQFRLRFITASGKDFSHRFHRYAQRIQFPEPQEYRRAA